MLIDNGRSDMIGTEFQEMLRCIRCAACMNHCPVYGAVGGHAYGWVYPGPDGRGADARAGRRRQGRPPAQRLHLLRQVRERLPGEDPAAQADAPLARARVRAPPDAGDDAHQPRRSGPGSPSGRRSTALATRAGDWRARPARPRQGRVHIAAARRRLDRRAATCRRRRAAPSWPATRERSGGGERAARDEPSDAILGAIRARPAARPAAGGPGGDAGGRLATPSAPPDPCPLAAAARRSRSRCSSATWRRSSARSSACRTSPPCPPRSPTTSPRRTCPPRFVMAPHPELQAIALVRPRPLLALRGAARAEATDLVSLQHGFAAHRRDRHADAPLRAARPTTLNLLAGHRDRACCAPPASSAPMRRPGTCCAPSAGCATGGFMPRNVMLVTGPRARPISSRRWNSARMGRAPPWNPGRAKASPMKPRAAPPRR